MLFRTGCCTKACHLQASQQRRSREAVWREEITFAFGTTAMWNHVMWQHPDDYIKLNTEKSSKPHQQAAAGAASGVPAQLPRMPASKREELHKGHARWLTKKKQPFALVEDDEYRAIWRSATHGTYAPPDRTTLRSFILELSKDGQERVRVVNEELRNDHRKPSIAGDIWSTKNHTLSLLGITQYHINAKWEIEELLVAADPFSRERHTSHGRGNNAAHENLPAGYGLPGGYLLWGFQEDERQWKQHAEGLARIRRWLVCGPYCPTQPRIFYG